MSRATSGQAATIPPSRVTRFLPPQPVNSALILERKRYAAAKVGLGTTLRPESGESLAQLHKCCGCFGIAAFSASARGLPRFRFVTSAPLVAKGVWSNGTEIPGDIENARAALCQMVRDLE